MAPADRWDSSPVIDAAVFVNTILSVIFSALTAWTVRLGGKSSGRERHLQENCAMAVIVYDSVFSNTAGEVVVRFYGKSW
jgi:hypothetical protein